MCRILAAAAAVARRRRRFSKTYMFDCRAIKEVLDAVPSAGAEERI